VLFFTERLGLKLSGFAVFPFLSSSFEESLLENSIRESFEILGVTVV